MEMERHGMPDYQREQPEQRAAVVVVPGRRDDDDDGGRHLFLDAGRVLMLWGWGALAAVSAAGRKNDDGGGGRPDDASSAVHALLALVLWLLGVSLVALVHVERRRFPWAVRGGAAVANAVVDCFFVRAWN